MTPSELAAKCAPLIADIGSSFYFRPETLAVGAEHGLGGFRFYFLGRGGVLGDVEPEVVTSAFGYFNPSLVDKMWNTSRDKLAPREGARLYNGCNADLGRAKLSELDLGRFCDAMSAVNEAVPPAALVLYSGLDAEPVPDDPPGRALHLAACLREARGSAHLAAIVSLGLEPRLAHYIRRPEMWEAFGWSDPPEVTSRDRELLAEANRLTDEMMRPPFAVLDPSGTEALLRGLDEIETALAA